MNRRRITWGFGVFVVALTIGLLLGATEARADTLQQEAFRQSNGFAVAAGAVLVAIGLANLAWNATRWLFRLGEWVWQNRPATKRERADAEALQAALDDDMVALIEATREPPRSEWQERAKAALEAEFANHHAMVDKLRGEDRIGRMVREAETDLCEQLWALPAANEPRRTT